MASSSGSARAKIRLTRKAVLVRSALAASNRSRSYGVRLKARMTRTPVICSRSTCVIRSIFTCIDWKRGIAKYIRIAKTAIISGRITIRMADSVTFSRTARMMPPTSMMGAVTSMVSAIWTKSCTCWTSLVLRVISEGVPKRFISAAENC